METSTETVPSLQNLMGEAYHLALQVGYGEITEDGHYWTWREDKRISDADMDDVSAWADGLVGKHYENLSSGHCSIQAMIDFDVAAFEASVVADIARFKSILERVGPPRRLTKQDLKERGYRGSGAGYTPEEDRLYYLAEAVKHLAEAEARTVRKGEFEYDDTWRKNDDIRSYKRMIAEYEAQAPKAI